MRPLLSLILLGHALAPGMMPTVALAAQDVPAQVAFDMAPARIGPPRPVAGRIVPLPVAVRSISAKPGLPRSTSLDPAGQCEAAVATAEASNQLPPRLLGAIALTESGRKDPGTGTFRPWPWSINAEGQGQFFASAQDAIAAVRDLQARGVQSIDVGCMQVNLMYHPRAFASLEEAFDPRRNAIYAAHFLNALYVSNKDWLLAAGAYHSDTPALAEPYRQQVAARWQNPTLRNFTPPVAQYRDFVALTQIYGDFSQGKRVYGAFTTGSGFR